MDKIRKNKQTDEIEKIKEKWLDKNICIDDPAIEHDEEPNFEIDLGK